MELASAYGLAGIGGRACLLGLPGAFVPDDDVAAAVLPGRDDPLEVEVLEGMVFDMEGGPPDRRVERGAFGDGPAGQHPIDLQPEVVVEPAGPMPLHHEPAGFGLGGDGVRAPTARGSWRSRVCCGTR